MTTARASLWMKSGGASSTVLTPNKEISVQSALESALLQLEGAANFLGLDEGLHTGWDPTNAP